MGVAPGVSIGRLGSSSPHVGLGCFGTSFVRSVVFSRSFLFVDFFVFVFIFCAVAFGASFFSSWDCHHRSSSPLRPVASLYIVVVVVVVVITVG
jgi:hypothetical protein